MRGAALLRSSLALWPLLALCLGTASCAGLEAAAPLDWGVTTAEGSFVARPVASLPDLLPETEGPHHVFEITESRVADAELLVVGSHGAVWLTPAGEMVRRSAFDGPWSYFPASRVDLEDGAGFLALDNGSFGAGGGRGQLVLFDPEGRRLRTFPAGYASTFFAAPLVGGDRRPEVVVEGAKGRTVDIFSLEGRRLATYDAGAYVVSIAPADADRDGQLEIVAYLYPVDGQGAFRVVEPGGRSGSAWEAPAVGDFAVVSTREVAPAFLTLMEDTLHVSAVGGRIVRSLPAPEAGRFQRVESQEMPNGGRVTLVSGGGDLDAHMLVLHDRAGKLLYRRVERGRARGLFVWSGPAGPTIYFGVGDTVWSLRSHGSAPAQPGAFGISSQSNR